MCRLEISLGRSGLLMSMSGAGRHAAFPGIREGQAGFPHREPGHLQEPFIRPHAQEAAYPDGLGHKSPEQSCKAWKEDIGMSVP